tara:strand:- start:1097 stop:1384 length:288 start_codon:yes stop_codon:yes gene_type:complete
MLEIMYRSKLKMIAPHKKAKEIFNGKESKIIERAKNEETTASIAVKTMVIPILVYFVISNRGQFFKSSKLAPEQLIKIRVMKLTLLVGFVILIIL